MVESERMVNGPETCTEAIEPTCTDPVREISNLRAPVSKLPELIARLDAGEQRVTGLSLDTDETFDTPYTNRESPHRAYITIIEGCDKHCAYCVVPFTRGPERSRTSASVIEEARRIADAGFTEIQLLGQNVNSYRDPSAARASFAELLVNVADVPGIRRVRFTTSHPRDFGRDIVEAIAELKAKGVKLQDEVPRPGHGGSQVAFLDQQSTGNLLIELVQMPADGTH